MDVDLTKHLQGGALAKGAQEPRTEKVSEPEEKIVYERVVDAQGRSYATGKRKRSVVRVWLSEGKGTFTINGRDAKVYFKRRAHQVVCEGPFQVLSRAIGKFDVRVTANGGGATGQAEALRLGLARAFVNLDPSTRSSLKSEGFLRRDNRVVERKKFGQKKARKRFQFSKR